MEKFKVDNRVGGRIEIKRSADDGKTWTPVVFVNAGAMGSSTTLARDIVVMMNILADFRVNYCPDAFDLDQQCAIDDGDIKSMDTKDEDPEVCRKCWENAFEKATGE
jgi:hypothetical protein